MEMGSNRCGKTMTTDNGIKHEEKWSKDVCSERPKFFPCSDCGRNFTQRALEIHKKSCTEKSDCACRVCKSDSFEKNVEPNGNCDENKNILLGFGSTSPDNGLNQLMTESLQKKKVILCVQKKQLNIGNSNQIIHLSSTDRLSLISDSTKLLFSDSPENSVMSGASHVVNNDHLNKKPNICDGLKIMCSELSKKNALHFVSKREISNKMNDESGGIGNANNLMNSTSMLKVEQNLPQSYIVIYSDATSPNPSNEILTRQDHKKNFRSKNVGLQNNKALLPQNALYLITSDDRPKPKQSAYNTPDHSLLCVVCNKLIFWDIFGCHIVQHSKLIENRNLLCPKCPQVFSKPGKLLIHFYKHMSEFSFICRECKKSFQLCSDLKEHALNDHGYVEFHPHHCYICLRRFSHSQTIINHMRLHSKETPFKCNECSRSFNQIGNLHRHLSVHRGERPHKCFQCKKSFADPATLRNHVRIHTGETPYVCKVCKRAFTQVGNLKRHMARHFHSRAVSVKQKHATKNEKVIPSRTSNICEVSASITKGIAEVDSMMLCDLEQNSKGLSEVLLEEKSPCNGNLVMPETCIAPVSIKKEHENNLDLSIDSKEKDVPSLPLLEAKRICKEKKWELFPCPACGKVYTWQHDLNIHFRIHSGEKPYKCDLCGKKFAQSGAVRIHKIRHHADHCDVKS